MSILELSLLFSTLLCSLVAGLVLTFAIVIMPGIRTLGDLGLLQAFKAIDRIIQDGQLIFMIVWLGSAVALIVSTVLGIRHLQGFDQLLLSTACAAYLLGVQLPTITINVPLNNRLQARDLASLNEAELAAARAEFEPRWIRWNSIRTVAAIFTAVLLLILLIRL